MNRALRESHPAFSGIYQRDAAFYAPGSNLDGISSLSSSDAHVRKIVELVTESKQATKLRNLQLAGEQLTDSCLADIAKLTALTDLGEEIPKKQGMSIAQAEYWSDTFDRWADDLVDPMSGGT